MAARALARLLSWLERCPVHQKVAGLIPSQGTYLGCGFDHWPGHITGGNQSLFLSHIDVFLSFSPPPSSLSKILG